jgi:hypothetical protein
VDLHRHLLLLFAGLWLQLRGSKIRPKVTFFFGEVEDIIDRIRLVGKVLGDFLTSKSARDNMISELP